MVELVNILSALQINKLSTATKDAQNNNKDFAELMNGISADTSLIEQIGNLKLEGKTEESLIKGLNTAYKALKSNNSEGKLLDNSLVLTKNSNADNIINRLLNKVDSTIVTQTNVNLSKTIVTKDSNLDYETGIDGQKIPLEISSKYIKQAIKEEIHNGFPSITIHDVKVKNEILKTVEDYFASDVHLQEESNEHLFEEHVVSKTIERLGQAGVSNKIQNNISKVMDRNMNIPLDSGDTLEASAKGITSEVEKDLNSDETRTAVEDSNLLSNIVQQILFKYLNITERNDRNYELNLAEGSKIEEFAQPYQNVKQIISKNFHEQLPTVNPNAELSGNVMDVIDKYFESALIKNEPPKAIENIVQQISTELEEANVSEVGIVTKVVSEVLNEYFNRPAINEVISKEVTRDVVNLDIINYTSRNVNSVSRRDLGEQEASKVPGANFFRNKIIETLDGYFKAGQDSSSINKPVSNIVKEIVAEIKQIVTFDKVPKEEFLMQKNTTSNLQGIKFDSDVYPKQNSVPKYTLDNVNDVLLDSFNQKEEPNFRSENKSSSEIDKLLIKDDSKNPLVNTINTKVVSQETVYEIEQIEDFDKVPKEDLLLQKNTTFNLQGVKFDSDVATVRDSVLEYTLENVDDVQLDSFTQKKETNLRSNNKSSSKLDKLLIKDDISNPVVNTISSKVIPQEENDEITKINEKNSSIKSEKESKVLESILSGVKPKKNKDSFIQNNGLFSTNLNTVKENERINRTNELVIHRDSIVEDVIDSVEYMQRGSIKELTVKVSPDEMGEITIKLIFEDGAMKANILAKDDKAYRAIASHLPEINQQLAESNTKIQTVSVNVYNSETTYYSQGNQDGSGQKQQKNSSNFKFEEDEEPSTRTNKSIDERNLNILA